MKKLVQKAWRWVQKVFTAAATDALRKEIEDERKP